MEAATQVDDRFTANHFTRLLPWKNIIIGRNIIDVNSRKATAREHKEEAETRYRVALTRFSGFPPVSLLVSSRHSLPRIRLSCLKS